ncbi:MAG TPA: histidine kinase [Trebonia sp.]|jgi:signal transduction histidine kinase
MRVRASELLAFLTKAEPRSAPSGWALALDSAVAVGLAAGAVAEVAERTVQAARVTPEFLFVGQPVTVHAGAATLIAAALSALPLAVRRLYPITVWLVIVAAAVAIRAGVPPVTFGAAVFAAYSAVVHSRYRNLAITVVVGVTLVVTAVFADTLPRFPGRLTALFAIVPAAAAGLGLRELRRRLNNAEAEQEAATQRALQAERARIAGELHDVVTHNVSVMVVQAGAARKILASSPGEAEEALLAVEATGRAAMTELRTLLGLLSPAGDGAGDEAGNTALRPQPGLDELGALIDRVSAAGLPVDLRVSGEPRPLPPGADLAAYRVVQEALTNVLRHAGESAASVRIEWGEKLLITVTDDGRGISGGPPGRGLLGLRERLSLYGGELDAGPRPGGGWRVRAVLPVEAAP